MKRRGQQNELSNAICDTTDAMDALRRQEKPPRPKKLPKDNIRSQASNVRLTQVHQPEAVYPRFFFVYLERKK